MSVNKASHPPVRSSRLKLVALMAAMADSGTDMLEAARCFGASAESTKYLKLTDAGTITRKVMEALERSQDEEAYNLYWQYQREVNTFIQNLRRSVTNMERGIRWATGLHKTTSDPLRTSLG